MITTTDLIRGRSMGIDLSDTERVRALKAERDGAFEIIERLQRELGTERQRAEIWRLRWVAAIGAMMGIVFFFVVWLTIEATRK